MEILVRLIASIFADSAPLVFASVGETVSEKAGVINLSLDGSMMLAALAGFAVAFVTGNVALGFAAAMLVGALVAALVAFASIRLNQDQVAVGFVLTLLCTDLSSFLGTAFVRKPVITAPHMPVPLLSDIPMLGPIFFSHSPIVYASFLLIFCAWLFIFKSQPGLMLQGIGERPAAAFARGANVNGLRYLYTVTGGALVGASGAAFSLGANPGWSYHHTQGFGWIALAIVIFGGWHPMRAAFGAYLFGGLQTLGSALQSSLPDLPIYVFQVAPFALMIVVLVLTNSEGLDRVLGYLPRGTARTLNRMVRGQAPAALGTNFQPE